MTPITSRTSVTHACPGGCGRQVPGHHFACHTDWLRLPFELRKPISANYRRDPTAHFEAMTAAMAWYSANRPRSIPDVIA